MIEKIILSVVTFSILSSVIGSLASNSVYKKYINQFTGMLFIIMLVNPVLELFANADTDKLYDRWKIYFLKDEYTLDTIGWEEEYVNATKEEYEGILRNRVQEIVSDICRIRECIVVFEENEESASFGEIKKISLVIEGLSTDKGNKENVSIKEYEIKDIIIDEILIEEAYKDEEPKGAYKDMANEVKKRLAEYFGLDEENISVNY